MSEFATLGGEQVKVDVSARLARLQSVSERCKSFKIADWVEYLNAINPEHMALGLDRVREVANRLHLFEDLLAHDSYIVTVAGTNGKGSSAALIAKALSNMGIKVGLFTSPHLFKFNERVRINDSDINDASLSLALSEVIQAQLPHTHIEHIEPLEPPQDQLNSDEIEGEAQELTEEELDLESAEANEAVLSEDTLGLISPLHDQVIDLTYFEITCLAAVRAFVREHCQVLILEVGLGGRLDAVNIFYNDIALITSIGLDHMRILGDTVEKIAAEKAGIIKPHTDVVIGRNMEESALREILRQVKRRSAHPAIEGSSFNVQLVAKQDSSHEAHANMSATTNAAIAGKKLSEIYELCYSDKELHYPLYLPYPKVPLACVGPALNALFKLLAMLGHKRTGYKELHAIEQALETVALPGRMQLVHSKPAIYLDVAHNVPAAWHLKDSLLKSTAFALQHTASTSNAKRRAVIAMLKDKDIEGVLQVLKGSFSEYYVASLHTERGAVKERLVSSLTMLGTASSRIHSFETVAEALEQAMNDASADDEIVVLGSFVTVAEAQEYLQSK